MAAKERRQTLLRLAREQSKSQPRMTQLQWQERTMSMTGASIITVPRPSAVGGR